MNVWFATNNSHKKEELAAILGRCLKIPSEEGISFDPDEIHLSFHENALLKACELKKILDQDSRFKDMENIVIADDSGLCVDALDGRPGVFSARYGDTEHKKLTSREKNLLLLKELGDNPNRGARFVCAMVLLFNDSRFIIVQETVEGEIVKSEKYAKGEGGFGYDPIFLIPAAGLTMAEISAEDKNRISHRGKAGKYIAELLRGKNAI